MSESISAMTWNVNGEIGVSEKRMGTQLEVLKQDASKVDIILFQAVNYEPPKGGEWGGQLGKLVEYFKSKNYCTAHTADWAHQLYESTVQPHQSVNSPHNRCNLTVSRFPLTRTPLSLRSKDSKNEYPEKLTYYTTYFPDNLLVTEVNLSETDKLGCDSMDIWNVGIINGSNWHEEKIKMLETVYARIYFKNEETNQPVLLGGDFNAPKKEHEKGTIVPYGDNVCKYTEQYHPFYGRPYYFDDSNKKMSEFSFRDRWKTAERNVFDEDVGKWDMRDVYWDGKGDDAKSASEDYTHETTSGTRKRLDHILVSSHFGVDSCDILIDKMDRDDGPNASDHAPVKTELTERRQSPD